MDATSAAQCRAVAAWLREARQTPTGIAALPPDRQAAARNLNARLRQRLQSQRQPR